MQSFLFRVPCARFSLWISLCKVSSLNLPVEGFLFKLTCSRFLSSLNFLVQGFLFKFLCARFPLWTSSWKVFSFSFAVQGFLFKGFLFGFRCAGFSLSKYMRKVFSLQVSSLIFLVQGLLFKDEWGVFSLIGFSPFCWMKYMLAFYTKHYFHLFRCYLSSLCVQWDLSVRTRAMLGNLNRRNPVLEGWVDQFRGHSFLLFVFFLQKLCFKYLQVLIYLTSNSDCCIESYENVLVQNNVSN